MHNEIENPATLILQENRTNKAKQSDLNFFYKTKTKCLCISSVVGRIMSSDIKTLIPRI